MRLINNIVAKLKIYKKFILGLLAIGMIVSLFLSVYALPYSSDDLIYMNQWNSDLPLGSISDIIKYQVNHYLYWGGRTVAHTILQIEFLLGKFGTSILIVIITFLIGIIISKMCDKNNKSKGLFVLLSVSLMLFLNPNYKETILWVTGSANYLWTMLIVLVCCYPFVSNLKGIEFKPIYWLCVMFSFFAGWCNENISTTLIVFMMCCCYHHFKKNKKIEIWMILSIVLATMGCFLLILAPGNFVRTGAIAGGIMGILYRGHGQINAWSNWLTPTIIMLTITSLVLRKRQKLPIQSILFISWGIMSVLIMLASPTYPDRATFGSIVLFIIPIITNLDILWDEYKTNIEIISLILIFSFIGINTSIGILQVVRNLGIYIPG